MKTDTNKNNLSLKIAIALGLVYLIWGSTYLAIRFAIHSIPPYLMAGTRFLIAGGIAYFVLRLKGYPPPDRTHWIGATVVGGLLLLGGNGSVVWAE
ncbi:MAG: drug/metabolite exporter YedA, partial [Methanobacteriota archaeon]